MQAGYEYLMLSPWKVRLKSHCISYFSVTMTKYHNLMNLENREVLFWLTVTEDKSAEKAENHGKVAVA